MDKKAKAEAKRTRRNKRKLEGDVSDSPDPTSMDDELLTEDGEPTSTEEQAGQAGVEPKSADGELKTATGEPQTAPDATS